ncbi:MAG: hypothetical protein KC462_06710, partial [Cyanobacteria bacterium HKST-UBA05]|nr:hypothetical protein [Cyanobacteria bacterium HKST-UBA05]
MINRFSIETACSVGVVSTVLVLAGWCPTAGASAADNDLAGYSASETVVEGVALADLMADMVAQRAFEAIKTRSSEVVSPQKAEPSTEPEADDTSFEDRFSGSNSDSEAFSPPLPDEASHPLSSLLDPIMVRGIDELDGPV